MQRTAFLAAALTLIIPSGCKKKTAAAVDDSVPVITTKVIAQPLPVSLSATGTIKPITTVTIRPQIDGIVKTVYFTDGAMVKPGEPLYLIDPAPFQEAFNKAQATLDGDTQQLGFLKIEEARYKMLLSSGAASQEDYDSHKTSYEQMKAQIDFDKAQVANARINLGYTKISSPFFGQTGATLVHPGATVQTNATNLVVLNQIAPIYAEFSLAEKYLDRVRRFMGKNKLKDTAVHQQDDGKPHDGILSFIDNSVDPQTGMIMMRGTFPNKDTQLWPGQFVTCNLTLDIQPDAIAIPASAVSASQQGATTFVVKPDGTVELRSVQPDRALGDLLVIASGLKAGETVVTDGQVQLRDGSKVSVKSTVDIPQVLGSSPSITSVSMKAEAMASPGQGK